MVKPFTHALAAYCKVPERAEVGKQQRAHGVFVAVKLKYTAGGAYAALERIATHAAARAHCALLKIVHGVCKRVKRVLLGNVQAAYVVKMAVVAFKNHWVYRTRVAAYVRVALQHVFHQRRGGRAHGKGVGQKQWGFYGAKLVHLHKAYALAEAVYNVARGGAFIVERIARMRQYCGYARVYAALVPRNVADPYAGNVGNLIQLALFHPAQREAEAALYTHCHSSNMNIFSRFARFGKLRRNPTYIIYYFSPQRHRNMSGKWEKKPLGSANQKLSPRAGKVARSAERGMAQRSQVP